MRASQAHKALLGMLQMLHLSLSTMHMLESFLIS